jgi:hypothetical protein
LNHLYSISKANKAEGGKRKQNKRDEDKDKSFGKVDGERESRVELARL